MKRYNKLILIILIILITVAIVGCESVTSYQNSIFENENKIIKVEDSFTYTKKIGKSMGNEIDIKFVSFSGMDTVYKFLVDEENDVVFNFESIIDRGNFKVVLITPDDEIINIVNGTNEGSEKVLLKKGTSRMKLVGKKAKGKIKINIDAGKSIGIKEID